MKSLISDPTLVKFQFHFAAFLVLLTRKCLCIEVLKFECKNHVRRAPFSCCVWCNAANIYWKWSTHWQLCMVIIYLDAFLLHERLCLTIWVAKSCDNVFYASILLEPFENIRSKLLSHCQNLCFFNLKSLWVNVHYYKYIYAIKRSRLGAPIDDFSVINLWCLWQLPKILETCSVIILLH